MIGRRDHGQVVPVRRRHVDGDAGGVEGAVGRGAVLIQGAAVGVGSQAPAAIAQTIIDGDFDLEVCRVSVGTAGSCLHFAQRCLHVGQLALEDQRVVACCVGHHDAIALCGGVVAGLKLQDAVAISGICCGQELHGDLDEVRLTRLRPIDQVDVAQ